MDKNQTDKKVYEQLQRIERIIMAYVNTTMRAEQKQEFDKLLNGSPSTKDGEISIWP